MANMRDQNREASVFGYDLNPNDDVGTVLLAYQCPPGFWAHFYSFYTYETSDGGAIAFFFQRKKVDGTYADIEIKTSSGYDSAASQATNIVMATGDRIEVRVGTEAMGMWNVLLNIEERGPGPAPGASVDGSP